MAAFDGAGGFLHVEDDAMLLVQRAHEITHGGAEDAFQGPLFRGDDMDLEPPGSQRRGNLQADETCAQHHRALGICRPRDDRPAIAKTAKHEKIVRRRAGHGEANRFGSRRQQQPVIAKPFAAREHDLALARLDACDVRVEPELDGVLVVETLGPQRYPLFRGRSREIVLGQVRPVDRGGIVAAQHHQTSLPLLPAQHFGGGKSRSAAANNHDRFRSTLVRVLRFRCLLAAFDDDLVALALDAPAGNRAQRRGMQRLARTQAETGMVPGTAHGLAIHQPLAQGTAIMGAGRADREKFIAPARQQNGLVAHMARQHRAGGEVADRNATGKVGTGGWRCIRHSASLRKRWCSQGELNPCFSLERAAS